MLGSWFYNERVRKAVAVFGSLFNNLYVVRIKKIAEAKMKDLNAVDIEAAIKIIAGSARSMGIQVQD